MARTTRKAGANVASMTSPPRQTRARAKLANAIPLMSGLDHRGKPVQELPKGPANTSFRSTGAAEKQVLEGTGTQDEVNKRNDHSDGKEGISASLLSPCPPPPQHLVPVRSSFPKLASPKLDVSAHEAENPVESVAAKGEQLHHAGSDQTSIGLPTSPKAVYAEVKETAEDLVRKYMTTKHEGDDIATFPKRIKHMLDGLLKFGRPISCGHEPDPTDPTCDDCELNPCEHRSDAACWVCRSPSCQCDGLCEFCEWTYADLEIFIEDWRGQPETSVEPHHTSGSNVEKQQCSCATLTGTARKRVLDDVTDMSPSKRSKLSEQVIQTETWETSEVEVEVEQNPETMKIEPGSAEEARAPKKSGADESLKRKGQKIRALKDQHSSSALSAFSGICNSCDEDTAEGTALPHVRRWSQSHDVAHGREATQTHQNRDCPAPLGRNAEYTPDHDRQDGYDPENPHEAVSIFRPGEYQPGHSDGGPDYDPTEAQWAIRGHHGVSDEITEESHLAFDNTHGRRTHMLERVWPGEHLKATWPAPVEVHCTLAQNPCLMDLEGRDVGCWDSQYKGMKGLSPPRSDEEEDETDWDTVRGEGPDDL